ncbi:MAG TPA: V-type ATPase 116kDa subunit family protein [Aminivibrio sp.]|uniref:V-type ATP synthase subunit I n=1 Tax=Aminivibrio sp. TaxID=1872489 RepID=UPI002C90A45C|nr:V-type ATPase 116kDa subunit family protein [Aminivibrio sp.]HPF84349.1 V-type ATPase 116kDa subunit family protein [Aminivibrio sp.]
MIRKMIRLALWGVTGKRREIIEELHRLGVLHLEQGSGSSAGESARLNTLRLLRGKTLGLLESLGWDEWTSLSEESINDTEKLLSSLPADELAPEIGKSLEEFGKRLSSLLDERTASEELLLRAKKARDILDRFSAFFRREDGGPQGKTTLWLISENTVQQALAALHGAFSSRGEAWDGRHHFVPGKDFMGVLGLRVSPELEGEASEILSRWKALPWSLPEFCSGVRVEDALAILGKKSETLSERLETISGDLGRASGEWGPRLAALFLFIDARTEQAAVEARLDPSADTFTLHGWIPEDALEATVSALKGRFGDDVLLQWRHPGEKEWSTVPTSLNNRPLCAPFELFLKLLRPPSYSGIDPTTAVALFFPFFSGCMIGDMGYGALILLLSLKLKKAVRPMLRDIGSILLSVSLWSIVWGAAWGEFFGDAGHRLFHLEPLWVERSVSVLPVVVFTVALGAAHVFFGLLLGIYQGVRNSHRHLWMEKAGNLAVLLALVAGLVVLKAEMPRGVFTVPFSLLVIGLALLIAGGGIGGIIETLGSIGNIISYVRIAAIGLSSAILALVASKFLDVFGLSVFGIFLALMIHLLNFVLAIGGSALHSARLHYVEFFGKFYSGNGKEYTPFQRRSGSSWKKHS